MEPAPTSSRLHSYLTSSEAKATFFSRVNSYILHESLNLEEKDVEGFTVLDIVFSLLLDQFRSSCAVFQFIEFHHQRGMKTLCMSSLELQSCSEQYPDIHGVHMLLHCLLQLCHSLVVKCNAGRSLKSFEVVAQIRVYWQQLIDILYSSFSPCLTPTAGLATYENNNVKDSSVTHYWGDQASSHAAAAAAAPAGNGTLSTAMKDDTPETSYSTTYIDTYMGSIDMFDAQYKEVFKIMTRRNRDLYLYEAYNQLLPPVRESVVSAHRQKEELDLADIVQRHKQQQQQQQHQAQDGEKPDKKEEKEEEEKKEEKLESLSDSKETKISGGEDEESIAEINKRKIGFGNDDRVSEVSRHAWSNVLQNVTSFSNSLLQLQAPQLPPLAVPLPSFMKKHISNPSNHSGTKTSYGKYGGSGSVDQSSAMLAFCSDDTIFTSSRIVTDPAVRASTLSSNSSHELSSSSSSSSVVHTLPRLLSECAISSLFVSFSSATVTPSTASASEARRISTAATSFPSALSALSTIPKRLQLFRSLQTRIHKAAFTLSGNNESSSSSTSRNWMKDSSGAGDDEETDPPQAVAAIDDGAVCGGTALFPSARFQPQFLRSNTRLQEGIALDVSAPIEPRGLVVRQYCQSPSSSSSSAATASSSSFSSSLPGLAAAAHSLMTRIFRNNCCVMRVGIMRLKSPSKQQENHHHHHHLHYENHHVYTVSPLISGPSLRSVLEETNPGPEYYLSRLEPVQLGQLLVWSMLVNPHDGRLDNYVLCECEKEMEIESELKNEQVDGNCVGKTFRDSSAIRASLLNRTSTAAACDDDGDGDGDGDDRYRDHSDMDNCGAACSHDASGTQESAVEHTCESEYQLKSAKEVCAYHLVCTDSEMCFASTHATSSSRSVTLGATTTTTTTAMAAATAAAAAAAAVTAAAVTENTCVKSNTHTVEVSIPVNCALFCLPQMRHPVHPRVVSTLLQINVDVLLKEWLRDIYRAHASWQALFTQEELTELLQIKPAAVAMEDIEEEGREEASKSSKSSSMKQKEEQKTKQKVVVEDKNNKEKDTEVVENQMSPFIGLCSMLPPKRIMHVIDKIKTLKRLLISSSNTSATATAATAAAAISTAPSYMDILWALEPSIAFRYDNALLQQTRTPAAATIPTPTSTPIGQHHREPQSSSMSKQQGQQQLEECTIPTPGCNNNNNHDNNNSSSNNSSSSSSSSDAPSLSSPFSYQTMYERYMRTDGRLQCTTSYEQYFRALGMDAQQTTNDLNDYVCRYVRNGNKTENQTKIQPQQQQQENIEQKFSSDFCAEDNSDKFVRSEGHHKKNMREGDDDDDDNNDDDVDENVAKNNTSKGKVIVSFDSWNPDAIDITGASTDAEADLDATSSIISSSTSKRIQDLTENIPYWLRHPTNGAISGSLRNVGSHLSTMVSSSLARMTTSTSSTNSSDNSTSTITMTEKPLAALDKEDRNEDEDKKIDDDDDDDCGGKKEKENEKMEDFPCDSPSSMQALNVDDQETNYVSSGAVTSTIAGDSRSSGTGTRRASNNHVTNLDGEYYMINFDTETETTSDSSNNMHHSADRAINKARRCSNSHNCSSYRNSFAQYAALAHSRHLLRLIRQFVPYDEQSAAVQTQIFEKAGGTVASLSHSDCTYKATCDSHDHDHSYKDNDKINNVTEDTINDAGGNDNIWWKRGNCIRYWSYYNDNNSGGCSGGDSGGGGGVLCIRQQQQWLHRLKNLSKATSGEWCNLRLRDFRTIKDSDIAHLPFLGNLTRIEIIAPFHPLSTNAATITTTSTTTSTTTHSSTSSSSVGGNTIITANTVGRAGREKSERKEGRTGTGIEIGTNYPGLSNSVVHILADSCPCLRSLTLQGLDLITAISSSSSSNGGGDGTAYRSGGSNHNNETHRFVSDVDSDCGIHSDSMGEPPLHFQSLVDLHVDNCRNLRILAVCAPHLQLLEVTRCPLLTTSCTKVLPPLCNHTAQDNGDYDTV